ncbi:MAG: type IX secretion system membrane protein PorP/SprF, partial [Pedobacter sp.]
MKQKIGLVIVFLTAALYSHAQQKPQYTQYIFNNYLLNPALSGMENYTDVKLGFRQQWQGITDAPRTSFVSANWALGDNYLWKNPLSLPEDGAPPMSRNYMQNYMSSPAHHGVGFIAVADKAGPISTINFNLTYAYHLELNDALNLSVGAGAGFNRIALDANSLQLENQQDPALANTVISQFKPDLNLGIWLYGARFFAGVSAQQVLPQKLSFTSDAAYTQGKEVAHYFVTTGYKLFFSEDVSVVPSLMFRHVKATPLSVDANVKISFKDRFWIGGSYRKNDSYAALAGININNFMNLTYAYDLTTSELRSYTSGSHEIVLGFQLNNIYHVLSTT